MTLPSCWHFTQRGAGEQRSSSTREMWSCSRCIRCSELCTRTRCYPVDRVGCWANSGCCVCIAAARCTTRRTAHRYCASRAIYGSSRRQTPWTPATPHTVASGTAQSSSRTTPRTPPPRRSRGSRCGRWQTSSASGGSITNPWRFHSRRHARGLRSHGNLASCRQTSIYVCVLLNLG